MFLVKFINENSIPYKMKEIDKMLDKYELPKLNELKNQSKKLAVSGEKMSNNILKDQVKFNSDISKILKEIF